jgi:exonuclease VII large subunit
VATMDSLSPLSTLRRGYAVCYKGETQARVTSYKQVGPGDLLRVVFAEGGATCEVRRAGEET